MSLVAEVDSANELDPRNQELVTGNFFGAPT
jgi:hypothetical protein